MKYESTGVSNEEFLSNNIDIDNPNGIIALWHDVKVI
jgi:hypothetical protein